MNTFVQAMEQFTKAVENYKRTENGAGAYKSTLDSVYDLFAFGGAYRQRTDEECIVLFHNAFKQSPVLAMKCLFYLRDVRGGGQGERRFFRVCYRWLVVNYPELARKFLAYIPFYGRWDDLIEVTYNTALFNYAMKIVAGQLNYDLAPERKRGEISLLGKWLSSENASSLETKQKAVAIRRALNLTPRDYRKMLSHLRKELNIVERLMSAGQWNQIEFDKLPSKAGFIYRNAFLNHEKVRYEEFMSNKTTKVNAGVLYPYEIVRQARMVCGSIEIDALDKYWENLPDYFDGATNSIMCVCDTSGSMTWGGGGVMPIDVAISLSIYAAEHNSGEFADKFITFSSRPQFVTIKGDNIVEKTTDIYMRSIIEDTNLESVFELFRKGCINRKWNPEDMPKTLVVISDMEINMGIENLYYRDDDDDAILTLMEQIRQKWAADGLEEYFPHLVYWNVNARNQTCLDLGSDVTLVSGCSPVLFKSILSGKKGYDLMMEALLSERYDKIVF